MYENDKNNFPTNVKQIGSIDDNFKIYIEDYVYTYIQQYSKVSIHNEKIAVLVGKSVNIEGRDVLFISGAIQGKYSRIENSMEVFSNRSWEYINQQMDLYFRNLDIVGWVYIQPGYGEFLNGNHFEYHKMNFSHVNDVLFVVDPIENTNSFFYSKNNGQGLEALDGYFIYFERNDGMHEYMLQNKLVQTKGDSVSEDNYEKQIQKEEKDVILKPRALREKGKIINEQRKLVNLLGTLSAVLFIVCFIMGAGLIQNDDRISKLERDLAAIDNSYKSILMQVKEENVQNVFAAQSGKAIEEVTVESSTICTTVENTEKTTSVEKQDISVNDGFTYTVQAGDSLIGISKKFYGTTNMVGEIMVENNMSDPDLIFAGKELKLPKK